MLVGLKMNLRKITFEVFTFTATIKKESIALLFPYRNSVVTKDTLGGGMSTQFWYEW